MIVGIGVDVCEVARFERAVERRPGLRDRLLAPAEQTARPESQAARFAAKEALAKALGAPSGMVWHDAIVSTDDHGRPCFVLTGTVAARAAELGIETIHLSLSHDAGIATAFVVCEAGR